MALFILLVIILEVVSASEDYKNDHVLEHFNNGMKIAKDFLGSESVALKVADFVVRAFQTANSSNRKTPPYKEHQSTDSEKRKNFQVNRAPGPMSLWRHLVKLLGLEKNQISAVAVNALIFVAQMITTFLSSPKSTDKQRRHDDPMKWMLSKNSKKLQELIATAKNESLPDLISEFISEQESKEETSCVRLLVCKIIPFVNKMQNVVFVEDDDQTFNANIRGADILYHYLPTQAEIYQRNDLCEKKFEDCNLNE